MEYMAIIHFHSDSLALCIGVFVVTLNLFYSGAFICVWWQTHCLKTI